MTAVANEQNITVISAEDLQAADKKYKVLEIGGTITNNMVRAVGLLTTSVRSGNHASACIQGVTKAWAAAAVASRGWPWTVTTSGWVTNANSGDFTGGRFLDTCNSGDLVRVVIDLSVLGYQGR